MAVDAAGNVYVTGGFSGSQTFGPFTLTSAGRTDVFLAKLDAAGTFLWVRQLGTAQGERTPMFACQ